MTDRIKATSRLSIRQLRYYVAVAETGQIKLAALRENISPSAITDSVKHLEQTLSAQLLERHRNGMKLTQEGYWFLEHAKSMIDFFNDTVNLFQERKFRYKGKVIVGTTSSVMGYFLPLPITRLKRTYPDIEIRLIELERSKLEKELLKNKIDIAVMISSNLEHHKQLSVNTLFSSNRTLWCSSVHPFATQKYVSLKQVCDQPYIQLTMDEALRNTQDIWSSYGRKPNTITTTESIEGVRSLVGNRNGVTILSELLYRPWSFDGSQILSKRIQPSDDIPPMDLGLVYRKEKTKNVCLEVFIEFFQHEFYNRSPLYGVH